MKGRKSLCLFLVFIMLLSCLLPMTGGRPAYAAEGGEGQEKAPVLDAKVVTATITGKSGNQNLFNQAQAVAFDEQVFTIHLGHKAADGVIEKGTKLTVELKDTANDGKNYIEYTSLFSGKKPLKDTNTGNTIATAEIDYYNPKVTLTFERIEGDLEADIKAALVTDAETVLNYFKANPDAKKLERHYALYINGVEQKDKITFTFQKPEQSEPTTEKFDKTRGIYQKKDNQEL